MSVTATPTPTPSRAERLFGAGDVLTVLPGLLVLLGAVLLAVFEGGYESTAWYPAALFFLVLLTLTVVVAPPQRGERNPLVWWAIVAYGLFCAWSFLGLLWADAPGSAWDGANRALLYGTALAVVVLRPWSPRAARLAFMVVAYGLAATALGILLTGLFQADPTDLLLEGRLGEPAGYVNATAGLWLIGLWPALALVLDRTLPWPVRALSLGVATLLLQTALLSQSRGAAIALAAAALVYVLLSPRRWPALAALGLPVVITAVGFDTVTDVRDAATLAAIAPAFDSAVKVILVGSVAAVVVGAIALVAATRVRPRLDAAPAVARGGDLALAALAVVAVAASLVAIGNPVDWADARWDDFKNEGYDDVNRSTNRFSGSLGSNRYDFYRVALDQFEEHPITGVGQDNFVNEYLKERRSGEAPRHPHSLVLRMLSQGGIVGSLLFFGAIALLTAAVWRARRRLRAVPDQAALVVGGFCSFVLWFVHAGGDWLWAFPALCILALGLLGVAARIEPASRFVPLSAAPSGDRAASTRFGRVARRSALGVAVLVAAISLTCAGIAARYTSAAYESSGNDLETALDRLDRAADLNPLSAEPLLAKGVLAQRGGQPAVAVEALREAADREPGNWFIHLELGLAAAVRGRDEEALTNLREAKRLNPSQVLIDDVVADVRRGRTVDPREVEQRLTEALQNRLSPIGPAAARPR